MRTKAMCATGLAAAFGIYLRDESPSALGTHFRPHPAGDRRDPRRRAYRALLPVAESAARHPAIMTS